MTDTWLRRAYPLVVIAALACAAYFQASAVGILLADAYLPRSRVEVPRSSQTSPNTDAAERAQVILSRNPFDSVTGPLTRPEPRAPSDDGFLANVTNPMAAPSCANLAVHVVTQSPDPTFSAAVLVSGAGPGVIRRAGDTIGEQRVLYIGFNPLRDSPSVWLASGAALCQVLLFEASTPKVAPEREDERQPKKAAQQELPRRIAERIRRLGPNTVVIDRTAVDEILESPLALLSTVRMVPDAPGVRLVGIRPGSLLGALGLKSGDRLENVNGFDVSDPGQALEAYSRLRGAESLHVQLSRGGSPTEITVDVR